MRELADFLLGPLLYLAAMSAAGLALNPLEPSLTGKVAAGALGSVLAVLALSRSLRSPLGRDRAVGLGLVALLAALGVGSASRAQPALIPLHAALLLAAAAGLGEAFASVIGERMQDASVLVTAALCLALFDAWSVVLGPASNAVSGGFLQTLLVEVPAPGGPQRFLGISDLVVIALLATLAQLRDWGVVRALGAGLVGLELALAQALATRHAAPALPTIGLAFCALNWRAVAPDAQGWRRTARWAAGSAVALGLVSVAMTVVGAGPR